MTKDKKEPTKNDKIIGYAAIIGGLALMYYGLFML